MFLNVKNTAKVHNHFGLKQVSIMEEEKGKTNQWLIYALMCVSLWEKILLFASYWRFMSILCSALGVKEKGNTYFYDCNMRKSLAKCLSQV